MNTETRERFAQLAMYIAGFGLMDLFVNMIGYHIGNIILFKIKLSQ